MMPEIIAHRGASYLAPENTLTAFRKAMEIGADGVEMDVQQTGDKKLVIHHDFLIDWHTDMRGQIYDMTVGELKALEELGVMSPLKTLGISKAQVRALAEEYDISVASKPSNSCLATRLPYGARLETPILEKIAAGEAYLKSMGFRSVRIRFYDPVTRIEVEKSQIPVFVNMREDIVNRLKELGFVYVTLDLEGFRSGSMDLVD